MVVERLRFFLRQVPRRNIWFHFAASFQSLNPLIGLVPELSNIEPLPPLSRGNHWRTPFAEPGLTHDILILSGNPSVFCSSRPSSEPLSSNHSGIGMPIFLSLNFKCLRIWLRYPLWSYLGFLPSIPLKSSPQHLPICLLQASPEQAYGWIEKTSNGTSKQPTSPSSLLPRLEGTSPWDSGAGMAERGALHGCSSQPGDGGWRFSAPSWGFQPKLTRLCLSFYWSNRWWLNTPPFLRTYALKLKWLANLSSTLEVQHFPPKQS